MSQIWKVQEVWKNWETHFLIIFVCRLNKGCLLSIGLGPTNGNVSNLTPQIRWIFWILTQISLLCSSTSMRYGWSWRVWSVPGDATTEWSKNRRDASDATELIQDEDVQAVNWMFQRTWWIMLQTRTGLKYPSRTNGEARVECADTMGLHEVCTIRILS